MNSLNELHQVIETTYTEHESEAEPISEREQALQTACDILLDYALTVKRATELTVESEADKTISNESNNQSQIKALLETLDPLQIPNLDREGQPVDAESHSGDHLCESQESLQSTDTTDYATQGSPRPTTAASSFVPDEFDNDAKCSASSSTKLTYHPDAADIRFDGRHLFRPNFILDEPPRSRRVLLGGLPADVKLPQLMLGLREVKGIVSAILVPSPLAYPISWNGALVEFGCYESASAFLQTANKRPPRYADTRGHVVELEAELIASNSYHATDRSMTSDPMPRTRTICFPAVNKAMAWAICRALPHARQIVAVEYTERLPCLYVQFSSVFSATAAWEACNYGRLRTDELWEVRVQCHCALDSIFSHGFNAACVPLVAVDLQIVLLNHSKSHPPKFPLEAPLLKLPALDSSEENDQSVSDRYHLSETQPAIRPQSDPANTKKTPGQLADERNKILQQSKWDAYGKLARHRRELAGKANTLQGTVACNGTCQFKCQPIQSAPTPEIIKKYLAIRQPMYADTGIEAF